MTSLIDALRDMTLTGTSAERRLARYVLENLNDLPFQTAASVAKLVEVSPMTVSRFLRRLGCQGFDALKSRLRQDNLASAWHVADQVDVLRRDLQEGRLLAELMSEQIETLHRLYEMSSGPAWQQAVRSLLDAREVFVASYQNIGGIARYFAEQLGYARDGVRYMDGLNGTYAELLDHPGEGQLLVLIDCRRFATKSRLLAEQAALRGLSLLLITDQYCDWIDTRRHQVLVLPPTRYRLWDSFMSLAALLDFLVSTLITEGGESVLARTRRIVALQDLFGCWRRCKSEPPRRPNIEPGVEADIGMVGCG